MKRLNIIALAVILATGTAQAQTGSELAVVTQPTSCVYTSLAKAGLALAKNNPKKIIALTTAGLYGAYKLYSQLTRTPEERLFEFNPDYSYGFYKKEENISPQTALIFSQGSFYSGCNCWWIDQVLEYKLGNSFTDKYVTVSFDYGDAENGPDFSEKTTLSNFISHAFKYASIFTRGLFRINLGGIPDAEVLLGAVKRCSDKNFKSVLDGHSRGSTAIIRALHMLSHPENTSYTKTWKKFGLLNNNDKPDTNKITKIKSSITKVFLANPMLDVDTTISTIATRNITTLLGEPQENPCSFWKKILSIIHGFSVKFMSKTLMFLLKTCTQYSSRELQPITLLEEIKDKNFDIHFSLTDNDQMVGNETDEALQKLVTQTKTWKLPPDRNNSHNHVTVSRASLYNHIKPNSCHLENGNLIWNNKAPQ